MNKNPTMNRTEILGCSNLHVTYQDGQRSLSVLNGVDLSVQQAEMVAIIGASGSGKTTLLHHLGLLDIPTTGEVRVQGNPTRNLSDQARTRLRNHALGYVYQFHHLLPDFSAGENVAMPLLIRSTPKKQAYTAAQALLTELGLQDRISHYPSELSGGERQRVALARALVTNPACVLADEPTGNLDVENAQEVFTCFQRMRDTKGCGFLIITHDLRIARQCDRVLKMQQGRLAQITLAAQAELLESNDQG